MVLLDNMLSEKGVVAGLLYKWVNIGKGWRPRWFVLEHVSLGNTVLSSQ